MVQTSRGNSARTAEVANPALRQTIRRDPGARVRVCARVQVKVRRVQHRLQEAGLFLWVFPYVCPEPVFAN